MAMALVTVCVVNACQRKLRQCGTIIATEVPGNSNKSEHFSYRGEWANLL